MAISLVLEHLGVKWKHKTFGERNPIEQWFGALEAMGSRCFYKRWPHNTSISTAQGMDQSVRIDVSPKRCLS